MISGLSCVPGAGFLQQYVYLYFYMQNEKQNPKCFISQPILSITEIEKSRNLTTQPRDESGLPEKDTSYVLFGKNQDSGFKVSEGIRSMHQTYIFFLFQQGFMMQHIPTTKQNNDNFKLLHVMVLSRTFGEERKDCTKTGHTSLWPRH